jgi:hypothetical protein
MGKQDWVFCHDGSGQSGKPPYTLECRRCGEVYSPQVPIAVDLYISLAKTFAKQHRKCRQKKGEGER